MLAPILAEVLYDKGPVWPLALFCATMLLVAIFAGEIFVGRAAALLVVLVGATTVLLVVIGAVSMCRHRLVRSNPPRFLCRFALLRVVVITSFCSHKLPFRIDSGCSRRRGSGRA